MMSARCETWGLLVVLACSSCAGSAKKDDEKPQHAMTMKTGKRLQKVGELARAGKFDDALKELSDIQEGAYLNPYERAKLFEMRAGLLLGKNPENPDPEIASQLEQALALDALPKQERLDLLYNLAQSYFMGERFSESADTFEKWAADAEKQEPQQHYLIASAFAQAKRYEKSLVWAKKAVDGNPNPPEPWLDLVKSLHYELKQDAEAAKVLERLVKSYPDNKDYLLQLAQAYKDMGDDKKALATLESAFAKGLLTEEREIFALASYRLLGGAGAKGAALLEERMRGGTVGKTPENYVLLAQCWIEAKEADKASAALSAVRGNVELGPLYYGVAQLHAERERWEKTRDALGMAFEKGGLEAPGDAKLLLGIAHYHTKRKDLAITSLTDAKRYGKATAQCADEWLKVVKSGKADGKASCSATGAVQVSTAKP
jgi:tetratricopeptide (TPR) repeat protein